MVGGQSYLLQVGYKAMSLRQLGETLDDGAPEESAELIPVHMSHCRTHMETKQYRHQWDVEQFSVQQEMCQTGDFISSTKFGDSQYEFWLKLFPCGKDEDCAGHLSLFLQIIKCPQAKLQFRVSFSIETLDGPRGCALNRNVVTINKGGIVTASKFYSIDTLKVRSHRFIPNDVLTIAAVLTVYGDTTSTMEDDDSEPDHVDPYDIRLDMSRHQPSSSGRNNLKRKTLASGKTVSFAQYLESGEFSDFEIVAEGRSFEVHRVVLAAHSNFFSAMLKPGHKEFAEGKVEMCDIHSDVLQQVLEFIYTNKCPEIDDSCYDIMYAADRLMVDGLKNQCTAILLRGFAVDNVCSRLELADRLSVDSLFLKGVAFFSRNRSSIMEREDWKDLRKRSPVLFARIIESAWEISDHRLSKRRRVDDEEE